MEKFPRIYVLVLTFFLLFNWYYNLYLVNKLINFFSSVIFLVIASWFITQRIKNSSYYQKKIDVNGKNILITGCDTGFGYQMVKKFDSAGFKVYGGCLKPENLAELQEICSENLTLIKMDVTNYEEVEKVINLIKEKDGGKLFGLINNAGISNYAYIEFGPKIDLIESQFKVNTFGTVMTTKLALPLLRKSQGRIVNMSSLAGRLSFTALTGYCMSKASVKFFSDGLRREMKKFNVKVMVVEPSMYKTNITNEKMLLNSMKRIEDQTSPDILEEYNEVYSVIKERLVQKVNSVNENVDEVINTVFNCFVLDDPEIYYRCCSPLEQPFFFILELLPESLQDLFGENIMIDFLQRITSVFPFNKFNKILKVKN